MLDSFLSQAASLVWRPWLVALLFGTHLFLSWKTGFIQRHLGTALRLSVTKDPGAPGDISQFGALMTALAATIGTGNLLQFFLSFILFQSLAPQRLPADSLNKYRRRPHPVPHRSRMDDSR